VLLEWGPGTRERRAAMSLPELGKAVYMSAHLLQNKYCQTGLRQEFSKWNQKMHLPVDVSHMATS